jgi:phosphopantetheinyl transferase
MKKKNDIHLWLIPLNLKNLKNTLLEKRYAKNLNSKIAKRYLYSRGYIRESLKYLLNTDPEEIYLNELKGKPPELENDLGFLSISYSLDILLLAHSFVPIGVDIEHKKRYLLNKKVLNKYFNKKDNFLINNNEFLDESNFLDYWVIKESIIKLKKGSIFLDAHKWNYKKDQSKSFNKFNGKNIDSFLFNIYNWKIGISSDNIIKKNNIFFCHY